MSKYIDADKLKRHYAWWDDEEKKIFDEIIDLQPTADVEEVRHGRWEWKEDLKAEDENGWLINEQGYVCSECGFIGVDNFNYCPNCGASMDEEKE